MRQVNPANGIVTGNNCWTWLGTELLNDIKQLEWKVSLDFADATFLGDPRTHKVYQGYSGEGTLTFYKKSSRGIKLLRDVLKTGVMPDLKIITKMTNPASGKSERAIFTGITFSEFGASSEAKAVLEESLPFSFSDIEFPETM